jgi:RNA polymerase sigma-70 factor (ECF subfamily)
MTIDELELLIDGCQHNNRLSQKRLYQQFYSMGMSICMRYARNREEAEEICQDGFVKAFSHIGECTRIGAFKSWLHQIFVRAAIDHYRKYHKKQIAFDELDVANQIPAKSTALEELSIEEKLQFIQALPAACRLTFNLYAIEEYNTSEIAGLLHVSEGTVRANLVRARQRLQAMIVAANTIHLKK